MLLQRAIQTPLRLVPVVDDKLGEQSITLFEASDNLRSATIASRSAFSSSVSGSLAGSSAGALAAGLAAAFFFEAFDAGFFLALPRAGFGLTVSASSAAAAAGCLSLVSLISGLFRWSVSSALMRTLACDDAPFKRHRCSPQQICVVRAGFNAGAVNADASSRALSSMPPPRAAPRRVTGRAFSRNATMH